MSLYLDVGINDLLRIEGPMTVTLIRKSGNRARLKFDGDAKIDLIKNGRDKPEPEKDRGGDE